MGCKRTDQEYPSNRYNNDYKYRCYEYCASTYTSLSSIHGVKCIRAVLKLDLKIENVPIYPRKRCAAFSILFI